VIELLNQQTHSLLLSYLRGPHATRLRRLEAWSGSIALTWPSSLREHCRPRGQAPGSSRKCFSENSTFLTFLSSKMAISFWNSTFSKRYAFINTETQGESRKLVPKYDSNFYLAQNHPRTAIQCCSALEYVPCSLIWHNAACTVISHHNYHFEMSNLGDSTLIYTQVTANKLGKLCELKISSFHSIQVVVRPSGESKSS
jgi:hypothetical protein